MLASEMDQTCVPQLTFFFGRGGGRTGLVVRALDSGFDPRQGWCVVSLSKRHLLPKSTGNTQEYGS